MSLSEKLRDVATFVRRHPDEQLKVRDVQLLDEAADALDAQGWQPWNEKAAKVDGAWHLVIIMTARDPKPWFVRWEKRSCSWQSQRGTNCEFAEPPTFYMPMENLLAILPAAPVRREEQG